MTEFGNITSNKTFVHLCRFLSLKTSTKLWIIIWYKNKAIINISIIKIATVITYLSISLKEHCSFVVLPVLLENISWCVFSYRNGISQWVLSSATSIQCSYLSSHLWWSRKGQSRSNSSCCSRSSSSKSKCSILQY